MITMSRPNSLIVLLVLCAAALRSSVAVKFETLEELLQYHEQQQNPDQDDKPNKTDEEFISFPTTTMTPRPVTTRHQGHHHHHHHEDHHDFVLEEGGSGQGEFLETTALTTMTATTTMPVQETEEPSTTRRMTTCCLLGEQAGRKRHHCNPDNYMPIYRNRNRGHNFKQTNKHPSQEKTQFDKCISGVIRRLAEEFQTCCEEAYKRMLQSERGEEYHHYDRTHVLEVPFKK